jgi:hypothetical protein
MYPPATAVLGSQHAQGCCPKAKAHTSDFSRCDAKAQQQFQHTCNVSDGTVIPSQCVCPLQLLLSFRGKDIGSQLLKHVVGGSSAEIYLTTLRRTIPFYAAAGFRLLQASEVPW